MINSDKSGVMFSKDPSYNNDNILLIAIKFQNNSVAKFIINNTNIDLYKMNNNKPPANLYYSVPLSFLPGLNLTTLQALILMGSPV